MKQTTRWLIPQPILARGQSHGRLSFLLLAFLFSIIMPQMYANVSLPAVFGNNMVLQRGTQVAIFGNAANGENVTVTFNGQTKTTTSNGSWKIYLDAMSHGGPYTLTIQGNNTVTFSGVLVGDVWLCSGQSNMANRISDEGYNSEVSSDNYPNIRIKHNLDIWRSMTTANIQYVSALGYFFAKEAYIASGVPIGIIVGAQPASGIEQWMDPTSLAQNSDAANYTSNGAPGGHFSNYIAPVVGFTISGCLWNQGENNGSNGEAAYSRWLRSMIPNWRGLWGYDFPFVITQLPKEAGTWRPAQTAVVNPYAIEAPIRQGQFDALSLTKTVLVTTWDISDGNIHPHNKREVAARAVLAYKKHCLNQNLEYMGPICQTTTISGNKLILSFIHTGGGLQYTNGLGMGIAGSNNQWYPANVQVSGNTLTLSNPNVASPTQARYMWEDNIQPAFTGNLTNGTGIASPTFRTDAQFRPLDEGPIPNKPVTGVTLSPAAGTIAIGGTITLTETVIPADASDKSVSWSSSNPAVASVNNGIVSGVTAGTCTITVSTVDGAKTASSTITVIPSAGGNITKVRIYPRSDYYQVNRLTNAKIQASNNNTNWTDLFTITAGNEPSQGAWKEYSISTSTTWRYFRYLSPNGGWGNIAELEFYNGTTKLSGTIFGTTGSYSGGANDTYDKAMDGNTATFFDGPTANGNYVGIDIGSSTIIVTGVTVSPSNSILLSQGGTQQLTATISPANASNKAINWTSNNPSVATVDASGLVTAVAPGTAIITVTTVDQNKTAVCTVTVNPVPVQSITLTPESLTLCISSTAQLIATISPSNATNKSIVWSVSNTSIVSVSPSGLVTALSLGTCSIIVSTVDGGKTDTIQVTVIDCSSPCILTNPSFESNLTAWTINSGTITVSTDAAQGAKSASLGAGAGMEQGYNQNAAGKPVALTYSAKQSGSGWAGVGLDFKNAAGADITKLNNQITNTAWQSGTITATAPAGTVRINVWAYTLSGTLLVDNFCLSIGDGNIPVESVSVSPSSVTINKGSNTNLVANVLPVNATNKSVNWSSSNILVATVNNFGQVTGLAAGTSTITAKTEDGNKTSTCVVTVIDVTTLTKVRIFPRGDYYQVNRLTNGKIQGSNNNSIWTDLFTVTAGNEPSQGAWKEYSINTSTNWRYVRYLSPNGGYGNIAEVEFYSGNTKLTGVKIGTPGSFQNSGNTFDKALDGNTNTFFDAASPDGNFMGLDLGGGNVPVSGLSISPISLNFVSIGVNQQLTPAILPENATNKNVSWVSSNPGIATVNSNGQVTSVGFGRAIITATTSEGGYTANCQVDVGAEPSSLKVGSNFWSAEHDLDGNGGVAAGNNTYGFAIWKPGTRFADNPADPWNPQFLSEVSIYNTLRFMDWLNINWGINQYWNDRTQKHHQYQSSDPGIQWAPANKTQQDGKRTYGVAWEWIIDLCNRKNTNMWINIPYMAMAVADFPNGDDFNNDYVHKLAILLRYGVDMKTVNLKTLTGNNLGALQNMTRQQLINAGGVVTSTGVNSNLKIYIELSNEPWLRENHNYAVTEGKKLGVMDGGYYSQYEWVAWALPRMWKAFADVFGRDNPQVVRFLCGVFWWDSHVERVMNTMNSKYNPWNLQPSYYSWATYVGGAGTTNQLGQFRTNLAAESAKWQAARDFVKNRWNLKMISYEGGQHFDMGNGQIAFAQNPDSYTAYIEWLREVQKSFDLVCHYTHSGHVTSWDQAWGAMMYQGQPLAEAHRYRALKHWVDGTAKNLIINDYEGESQENSSPVFRVYPNPVQAGQDLVVDLHSEKDAVISLFTVNNMLVSQQKVSSSESLSVGTTGLKPGIYILSVTSANYNKTIKVIIE